MRVGDDGGDAIGASGVAVVGRTLVRHSVIPAQAGIHLVNIYRFSVYCKYTHFIEHPHWIPEHCAARVGDDGGMHFVLREWPS